MRVVPDIHSGGGGGGGAGAARLPRSLVGGPPFSLPPLIAILLRPRSDQPLTHSHSFLFIHREYNPS